jgi:hypothetical protein
MPISKRTKRTKRTKSQKKTKIQKGRGYDTHTGKDAILRELKKLIDNGNELTKVTLRLNNKIVEIEKTSNSLIDYKMISQILDLNPNFVADIAYYKKYNTTNETNA